MLVIKRRTLLSTCSRLGYAHHGSEGINFSVLDHYKALGGGAEAADFPGGILELRNGAVIGTIRIAAISEHNYPDACTDVTGKLGITDSGECNDNCANKVEIEAANLLLGRLARRAATLRAAGASYILVDVSQNGGGSQWVDAVARTLSPVPLNDLGMAYMRNAHWTKQLQGALDDIESDIQAGKDPRALLEHSASTLQTAVNKSKETCDQTPLWTNAKVSCSLMIGGFHFPFELLSYAPSGAFNGLKSKTILFSSLAYSYRESSNRRPLLIVVDKDTWSAAEYLPALVQDNKAGLVVGELTGGAGCGYTNGGIPTVLKNSGATIRMPDCITLRKDGSNEIEGVTPDTLIPWASRDTPYERARKLELGLEAATRGKGANKTPGPVR